MPARAINHSFPSTSPDSALAARRTAGVDGSEADATSTTSTIAAPTPGQLSVGSASRASARAAAESLCARAFSLGKDIFLAPGESITDARLIAHEAAGALPDPCAPR